MSKTKYKQCVLERKKGRTGHIRVAYIPEKYAEVGKILKLKTEAGGWSDGWKVIFAQDEAVDEPPDYRKAIRSHRKRTGDSLPKK